MVIEASERTADEKETGRIEAFSDGVFAIAITLLVLDLKVPQIEGLGESGSLLHALARQWPTYLAFLTSFATILIMWVNHHNLLKQIVRADHAFLLLNGLLLLAISIVPFPTALVSEYLQHREAKTAAVIYALVYVCLAIFFNLMWRYASRNGRLLARNHDRVFVRDITRQYAFGPALYLVAVLLALVNAVGSFIYCMLLAVFFAVPTSVKRKANRPVLRAYLGEQEEE